MIYLLSVFLGLGLVLVVFWCFALVCLFLVVFCVFGVEMFLLCVCDNECVCVYEWVYGLIVYD